MATLVKTGIGDGQTLTPVIITELYDAFTGDKLFDNIIINNNETLIGRSHHFPVKLYSCLAGFVELGETLENAAMREIKEEVGLNIYDIKFITNQPWPFPSSLMFGLIAKAKNKLNHILKPKDTVVFMGAGSISSWCNDYAKQFKLEDLNVK